MFIVTPKLAVVRITDSNMLQDKRIEAYPRFQTEEQANKYISTVIQTVHNMDRPNNKHTSSNSRKGPRISKSPTAMTHQQYDRLKHIVSEKSLLKN